ncbi:hypothetical protein ACJMK2_033704 [Sinanodonta woodiana]|uniref:WD repeat and FYVE domain-containing protein 3 n=1 Tax=Sinanodonta woodiana TaxID=1069815 RepID=A0ABD3WPS3_SINWO
MSQFVRMFGGKKAAPTSQEQDTSLGLMHLKKLFHDFRHPSHTALQKDQEDKLYNMLPLFCKIFGNIPSSEMTDKFGDILQFCSHVSKLMVTEIRRKASNQSTEAASCAIVKFLEIESTEESSNGWMLLSALNLLSVGPRELIDCMTAASLPSTLVKCLYLFFDLPPVTDPDLLQQGCEFSPRERRVLLQKVFVQVLVRLCSHVSPAEELARKDDLSLLFSAITSWCPAYNTDWRKSAGEVLVTLSRHGLTEAVVRYIHEKGCVRHCTENMQRAQELLPLELVEMFVTVFCFLKDSSEVSQVLLEDFRTCQGYGYLSEFLLKLEQDPLEDSQQALRNLVLLIGSLTNCGYTEIKPSQSSNASLFQIPGFYLPHPVGKGVSVRNVQAFQVLQSVFLKATTSQLCNTILDVISSIYHQDNANYFILEPQHTLSQFAEKIHLKALDIQEKFFDLLEFIVFDLNFVPCKELISISLLIKSQHSVASSILCLKSLLKILQYHNVFKDVFREVGMLEVLVTCLHRFAALLKEPQVDGVEKLTTDQRALGFLVMEALALLLSSSNQNAVVFRECGGARCSHNMIVYLECRQSALNIVQQLILTPGGDDDMGTLLGLMHTADVTALELKTHILKSLLNVLRESHKTRTVFRKVGGFVYVMSVLVSMEGCLADPPKSPWDKVNRTEILIMLKTVFSTLTVAMRYEPANAKFFTSDVRYDSLTEAVRLLGCFSSTMDIQPIPEDLTPTKNFSNMFEDYFQFSTDTRSKPKTSNTVLSCCLMMRNLYDMALDAFDRPYTGLQSAGDSPSLKRLTVAYEGGLSPHSSPKPKRASTGSMNTTSLTSCPPDLIIHTGAIMSLFHLLPAVECEADKQLSLDLQVYLAELLKNLLRTEHNQQVMCDAGFPHELLNHGNVALTDESHPLHSALQHMFERLASQSLTPRDLRDFLRLGSPLSCRLTDDTPDVIYSRFRESWPLSRDPSLEEKKTPYEVEKKLQTAGCPVPLTRVKCLVSMTTPRDARMNGSSVTPTFVEFDMSTEGFGCLYLPSIAPQGPPTPSVVSGVVGATEPIVIGGIGTGERVFPPQAGMTYSTWYCVDKFSTSVDQHPVRLLTIVRNLQGRDENLICLSVYLSSRDKSLIVCTQETCMPQSAASFDDSDPKLNDNTTRFWHPEFDQEGQWHHLVLIFNRAGIMKNSNVSLFIDGEHIETKRIHYISPNLGVGGTASPTAFTSVFAYIGTPPQLRRLSKLSWRQGPCHLLEDIISVTTVKNIYNLGPTYIGNFLTPYIGDLEIPGPFIPEEKVVFGIHAPAVTQLTVAKIRKMYNKVDSKSIAKQLAMSTHDNATPIRILHNTAGHLGGPARSLGGVLMGYIGVRTFCPRPVAKMLENVGGTLALLGLIAMATDVEGLYAAVKALVCVVKSNKSAMMDLTRIKGYQILAMLYKKKQQLLNSHILHLTFSLVGTVDSGRESAIIPNTTAFEDLLCDLEVWHAAPGDLQRSLYEHFYELLTESSDQMGNRKLMREKGLGSRLLHILKGPCLSRPTMETIASVLGVLLDGQPDPPALLKNISSAYKIHMRNCLIDVVYRLLSPSPKVLNVQFCEDLERVLGFDWLLLFIQGHLHNSTIIRALKLLVTLLKNSQAMSRFREGSHGGSWLKDTDTVLKQGGGGRGEGVGGGAVLGFSLQVQGKLVNQEEINREICHVPGFTVLQWWMPRHVGVIEVYFLLMALLLGQRVPQELATDMQLNLDAVWTVIFGAPSSKPASIIAKETSIDLCPEAALVILAMVRHILNQDSDTESCTLEQPITLIQFLLFLYHNQSDFVLLATQHDFIAALAATLFPYFTADSDGCVTTPNEEFKPFPDSESMVYVRSPDKDKTKGFLSSHPACKLVIEFLRTIVIDSFYQPISTRSTAVIDIMLEAFPEHATRTQQREYQTEILKTLMDHLLAADILLGDLGAHPGANYSIVAQNVFYFASRVVDKLWQGAFTRDSKEVFDFISKLISQAKRKSTGVSLDQIYKSLNRTILFQLSRPVDNIAGQTLVLDALHKMTSNRSLVFGPGNYDQEFLGCLCYCLLNLTDDPVNSASNLREIKPIQTTWHFSIESPGEEHQALAQGNCSKAMVEGLQLVASAARRVWEELYICKKPVLEELFRTQLNNIDPANPEKIPSPDLHIVRPLIQESASKIWVIYADNERRGSYMLSERLPAQIQSKLQKVGMGVLKLTQKKSKKELPLKTSPSSNVHLGDYEMFTANHVAVVKDLVELQFHQYLKSAEHMEGYLIEEWAQMEQELLRERGLWGPTVGCPLDKWMLDMTEGPFRMRKKMLKNDMFYIHYPYRPDMEDNPLRYKVALSHDSKDYYEKYRSKSLFGEDTLPIRLGVEDFSSQDIESEDRSPEDLMKIPKLLPKKLNKPASVTENEDDGDDVLMSEQTEGEKPDFGGESVETQIEASQEGQITAKKTDNQAIVRLLGEEEKISHMFRCARIQGLDTAEGLLLFGKEHFHIIDGFTILASKEIKDIDSLPPEYSKFAYDDIREVHKRRYLLQPIAIEVFSADGRNYLLSFPRKIRNKVYAKFLSLATAITNNAQQSVSGQRQNTRIEAGSGLISSLIGEKSVTQRWERGEINNFQYLMHLNTLAGRSYNDLMQYPVFPWILAEYDSEDLDLNNAGTFRDLSCPMGAQTPERLKQFKKRFQDWDDPQGETPPYHYGTHYSSAMIVASYLVRMEPFTQTFLKLQGGHFDLADRMFHSIKENWMSAAKHNMADVKELIPEFFYLPEFLANSNNFDLGNKQSGVQLGDVVLPPWAKNDPREFIRAHREALECDFVSAHLHEWIDLIFGYKQQGSAAVEAVNVFHHLFYEGNVDIYSIDDPLKKNATIGFINNFGQIPKQLFRKPHPQKKLNIRLTDPIPMGSHAHLLNNKLFYHNVDNLKPCMQPFKELKGPVGQILHSEKYLLAVDQNKVLIPPNYNKYLAWGFADLSIRIGNYESEKATVVFEGLDNGEILCAACPNSKIFITGGTSCVVNVWEHIPKEKRVLLKAPLYGHTEPVTCVAASPAYNIIVSGSRDRTCIIWDLMRLVYVRQLRGHSAPIASVCINELTGDIATCAGTYLHLWSINMEEIACVNTASIRSQQILCVAMSQMWSVEYVQVPVEKRKRLDDKKDESENSCLDATKENNTASVPVNILRTERRHSCNSYGEDQQNAVNHLRDFKDPGYISRMQSELGSSVDSDSHLFHHIDKHQQPEVLDIAAIGDKEGDIGTVKVEQDEGNISTTSSASDLCNGEEVTSAVDDYMSPGDEICISGAGELTAIDAQEYEQMNIGDTQVPSTSEPCLSKVVDPITEMERSLSHPDFKLSDQNNDQETNKSPPSEFEVIEENEIKEAPLTAVELVTKYKPRSKHSLRDGFRWQRQLVFRSKLTMHTAYERKDNKDPAPITSLAISRDHKTVYVGDGKGRIFSWTVTDQPGKVVADHWVKDEGSDSCLKCGVKFSFAERRHHCRNCGQVLCSRCSRFETEIQRLRIWKPVRVCQACYNSLKAQHTSEIMSKEKR